MIGSYLTLTTQRFLGEGLRMTSGIKIDAVGATVTFPSRRLPVAASVDVLVAGGGPSGFGAALAASRQGVSTLLIERNAGLGGASTMALMNTWNVPPDHMTGIAREVTLRLIEQGAAVAGPTVPFDIESLKELELQLLLEAGARVLTYTAVVEPLVEDGTMRGVLVHNKSGLQAILAGAVVDTTGDADIAATAGASVVKGRESDGKMRPVSVLFRLGGVNIQRAVEYCRQHPEQFTRDPNFHILKPEVGLVRISGYFDLVAEARVRGEFEGDINYIRFEGVQVDRGIVTVNSSRVYGVDGTNAWDVTRADFEARRQNRLLCQFIKRHVPGCENCYVIDSASSLGVRETRRIRGDHVLTEEDILAHRTYPDSVAKIWRHHAGGRDWHSPDGGEGAPDNLVYRTLTTTLDWFEIPYGIVIPTGIEGLLVAGRTLSQTHEADMWTRGQYCCVVTGQVAGTAAALSRQARSVPRVLDIGRLQRALIEQNVDIGAARTAVEGKPRPA
jgi:glycine/D-amino acid oxidase-like deaminating enzyme